MDCAVVLFRHGAPLLCEIAICQAASSVFLAPTASFSPIGQMLLVFGGVLLPSAGSDALGAEQIGFYVLSAMRMEGFDGQPNLIAHLLQEFELAFGKLVFYDA